MVDEPESKRLLRSDHLAGEDQATRRTEPDQSRQPEGGHAREKTFLDGRQPESAVAAADADVAGDRELEPAAQAVAVEGGNHDLVHQLDLAESALLAVVEAGRHPLAAHHV